MAATASVIEKDSSQEDAPAITPEQARFAAAWGASFGLAPVKISYSDDNLNARVYTLDGDTGYRVRHPKEVTEAEEAYKEKTKAYALKSPSMARRGEDHGRAIIDKRAVLGIREWASAIIQAGETPAYTAKAKEYGISPASLRDIVMRRTWKHI